MMNARTQAITDRAQDLADLLAHERINWKELNLDIYQFGMAIIGCAIAMSTNSEEKGN